ncbi:MAG TPA: hypothetical protein VKQ27_19680 [Acetobacteraceae bacterium]|nr:hypothetical protein [Acetobacteraceae bacterium]
MKGFVIAVALGAAMLATSAQAGTIKAYKTETGAQKHCPSDQVVWANSASTVGAFHLQGSKFYGATKNGAYVCRGEAEAGGWHAAANGQ